MHDNNEKCIQNSVWKFNGEWLRRRIGHISENSIK